jgi:hypothetical protein
MSPSRTPLTTPLSVMLCGAASCLEQAQEVNSRASRSLIWSCVWVPDTSLHPSLKAASLRHDGSQREVSS